MTSPGFCGVIQELHYTMKEYMEKMNVILNSPETFVTKMC